MLASIQKILKVEPHPNADKLELAHVLGYKVVVKKDEFKEGDLCMYVQVDTILPQKPEFEFLNDKGYRVRFVKLRGIVSQGICFPLEVAMKFMSQYYVDHDICGAWKVQDDGSVILSDRYVREGDDVTQYVGVKKYEKPEMKHDDAAGDFPLHLASKTDESRIENYPDMLEFSRGKLVYISKKHDGTSFTYINSSDERYGEMVCSRNLQIKEGDNKYWDMVRKYDLTKNVPKDYYIQGEIVGPKIQNNPEGLKDFKLKVFNVRNMNTNKLLDYSEFVKFCQLTNLEMVDEVYIGPMLFTYDDLLEMAENQKYENGKQAEGIVVRLLENKFYDKIGKEFSFKVISPSYALKHGE